MADNQLSGKLETAIASLDNLTKVYHAFVNAKPVPGSSPGHRYDADLVPTSALEAQRSATQQHYAGISENIAGLIENILSLKAAVKDVFLSTTSTTLSANNTALAASRRAYVRRMINVRRSTHSFQVGLSFIILADLTTNGRTYDTRLCLSSVLSVCRV